MSLPHPGYCDCMTAIGSFWGTASPLSSSSPFPFFPLHCPGLSQAAPDVSSVIWGREGCTEGQVSTPFPGLRRAPTQVGRGCPLSSRLESVNGSWDMPPTAGETEQHLCPRGTACFLYSSAQLWPTGSLERGALPATISGQPDTGPPRTAGTWAKTQTDVPGSTLQILNLNQVATSPSDACPLGRWVPRGASGLQVENGERGGSLLSPGDDTSCLSLVCP